MKLKLSEFRSAVAMAMTAINKSSEYPMAKDILIRAGDGSIVVVATNTTVGMSIVTSVAAESPFSFAVDGAKLAAFTSALDGEELHVSEVYANDGTESRRIELASGPATYTISFDDALDFPAVAEFKMGEENECDADAIVKAIDGTVFATSSDLSRVFMQGVHFETNGEVLEAAALDGHRIAVVRVPLGLKFEPATVPTPACLAISKLLDGSEKCFVGISGEAVQVRCEATTVYARPIQESFPPYRAAVPKLNAEPVIAPTVSLSAAIRRMLAIKGNTYDASEGMLKFWKDKLLLARSVDMSRADETIQTKGGSAFSVWLNLRYLSQALDALSDEGEVEIHLGKEWSSPVIVTSHSRDRYSMILPLNPERCTTRDDGNAEKVSATAKTKTTTKKGR